ncbi:MAG: hypothetical protein AMJ43_09865 [Coxiella sp. DG_40]|nr:MAG: hypothetical protein AMJ43_09865 [Coxiella sp. DG_40]
MKICLVCSSGGHFFTLRSLQELWNRYDRFWVTFPAADTKFFLRTEKAYWAYYPTNRNIKNFIKNLFLAFKILQEQKPDVIISTGAGVAVPFMYMGKILRIKTIYIESLTRIETFSLSGKLAYPVVDCMLVQWPELASKYKRAIYRGQVI